MAGGGCGNSESGTFGSQDKRGPTPTLDRQSALAFGARDLREAKERLTDWFAAHVRGENAGLEEITLAQIFANYWDDHGKNLSSSKNAKCASASWIAFFGDKTLAEITPVPEQRKLQTFLAGKRLKPPEAFREMLENAADGSIVSHGAGPVGCARRASRLGRSPRNLVTSSAGSARRKSMRRST